MQGRHQRPRKTWPSVDRRHAKIYFFEVALLVQLAVLHFILYLNHLNRLAVLHHSITTSARVLVPLFAGGVAVRLVVSAFGSGGVRGYLRRIRRGPWIFLSVRLLLATAVAVHIYVWIKSMLPILNPRLYDAILWELDRRLFFGASPNVLSLYLFRQPGVLQTIDFAYGLIFAGTLLGGMALFFSCRSDRQRIAFATGYSCLWLAGAWLYLILPSLGPCYVFPEVWKPFVQWLPASILTQQALWENRQMVPLIAHGLIPQDFNLQAGIAAFPSLHVGLQAFAALWAARLWRFLRLAAYLSVAVVFVGSIVTGWHYLIDSAVGLILGWGAFHAGCRLSGQRRWV